MNLLI
jgi:hypothetical protein